MYKVSVPIMLPTSIKNREIIQEEMEEDNNLGCRGGGGGSTEKPPFRPYSFLCLYLPLFLMSYPWNLWVSWPPLLHLSCWGDQFLMRSLLFITYQPPPFMYMACFRKSSSSSNSKGKY